MSDFLFWVALGVATISALLGRMLVNFALQYVKGEHPAAFQELAAKGRALIPALSGPDGRVRRALAGRMLWGGLPEALDVDPQIQRLRSHWRMLATATAIGFASVVIVIAGRVPAG